MLKKNIKYTDYNGVERSEDFFFNLSKAELMEMEMGTTGGLAEFIKKIIMTQDQPKVIELFKKLILKAYGEKSEDGKRFIKKDSNGVLLADYFEQTEAYSVLFMELATDDKAAAEFVNGIIPGDVKISEEDLKKLEAETNINMQALNTTKEVSAENKEENK
jgi:hypothetical protein